MQKNFKHWLSLKERIHNNPSIVFGFDEGDIWWAAVGENIGIEINGKNKPFSRPVLIYRKLSNFGFMAIPLSTKNKQGTWYSTFDFQGKKITANLSQARVMDIKRLYGRLGTLEQKDLTQIKTAFANLYQ